MMYRITVLLFSIFQIQLVVGWGKNQNPIVKAPCGDIQGSIISSVLGRSIYSFRGIRYAKPPVGELRFKPPVPEEKWNNGTYDATKDAPACPQPGDIPTSEDCLMLTVYTTELPFGRHNPKRPVMFYIHPGGFYSLSSVSRWVGPHYYLDQDIVLVTINYRLASLGFISTGDHWAPGNNGFKDQIIALKWVKENIASFGGDPNLVTIIGFSAGGVSVAGHLLSPMSIGLFHRAIGMSALVFGQTPIGNHQFRLAQVQARLVGCPDDTSENIIKCLRTKSAKELGDSVVGFSEYGDLVQLWTPVIEPDYGQERFLIEHPIKSAMNGNFQKVPIMAGLSQEEFSYLAIGIVNDPVMLKRMDEEFDTVAPIAFVYERNTTKSRIVSQKLREKFLGPGPLNQSSAKGIGYLYADGIIGFGVNRGVKLFAAKNTENTYYYLFSFPGRYSYFYLPNTTTPYGVVHHDDLIYMFYSEIFPKLNTSDPEYVMVKKLTTLHTNFACTGNPTPSKTEKLDNVVWNPFTSQNNAYLDIGKTLTMKKDLYKDRYSEWERLFPLSDYQ